MARQTDVLQVVTLERMKRELRIAAGETDHDSMIAAQLRGAASWVSQHLGQPVVESVDTFNVAPPAAADAPLVRR